MAKQKKKKIPRDLRMLKNVIQPKAEEVKKSVCSFSYFVTLVKTLCLIVFYYFFSITLTFYNQHFIHVSDTLSLVITSPFLMAFPENAQLPCSGFSLVTRHGA